MVTRTTFIAETCNPHTAILRHDLVCFTIVAHDGRTAMKRIGWIVKPLLREKEVSEIRYGLNRRFKHQRHTGQIMTGDVAGEISAVRDLCSL
jgi:hypothetical protein